MLLQGARLLTLTGAGGSGKTRLAIEAAAELVPEFRNGVFWVSLAPLCDPTLVLETAAQTLGAKDGLAEHIAERELLLVLDNLEQVVEAAPELASLVESCPNLKLLVTSRELLRVRGEVEYAVLPLAEPEAVELFPADRIAHPVHVPSPPRFGQRTLTKRYGVADVCSKPGPASEKGPQTRLSANPRSAGVSSRRHGRCAERPLDRR
jgi:hypothetical protein